MTTKTKLTPKELKVLQAIVKSEYNSDSSLTATVWTFTIGQNSDLIPKSIPGIVCSLVKKGLVTIGGFGTEATITMTKTGADAYVEATLPPGKSIEQATAGSEVPDDLSHNHEAHVDAYASRNLPATTGTLLAAICTRLHLTQTKARRLLRKAGLRAPYDSEEKILAVLQQQKKPTVTLDPATTEQIKKDVSRILTKH